MFGIAARKVRIAFDAELSLAGCRSAVENEGAQQMVP